MDRLIYTAASGARSLMERQDGIAHNLANAGSAGFRADLVTFRAVPVRGEGATTRVAALEATAGFDLRPGPLQATGRSLDVALPGRGWLVLQAADGAEALTRHGGFEVSPEGTLVGTQGLPVLGDGGNTLSIPAGSTVQIAADGTVSAQPASGPVQVVGRLKLVDPPAGDLRKGGDGLVRITSGEPAESDPALRLVPGSLEGSNVSVVEAMVSMIAASRQFETQMKLLQQAEQNDQRGTQLLSAH